MQAHWLREARQRKGWTQSQVATRLGVSQTYLSLVENGRRALSKSLARKIQRDFEVPATELPVESRDTATGDPQVLANGLGVLGYPGFTHFKRGRRVNPAQLLFTALRTPDLEPRLAEALPWVVWHYSDLNWPWLLAQAKLHDLQNRLGFVVALARQVAERHQQPEKVSALAAVEAQLEPSRLVREDTLCRESMTQAERKWLRRQRPASALHWNLLTGLVREHLSYAP
jgi:transcriptional regulator with XRE-family HTH domain